MLVYGINVTSFQWCGCIFVLSYTHLNLALLPGPCCNSSCHHCKWFLRFLKLKGVIAISITIKSRKILKLIYFLNVQNSTRDFNSDLDTINHYWIDPVKHFCLCLRFAKESCLMTKYISVRSSTRHIDFLEKFLILISFLWKNARFKQHFSNLWW